MMLKLMMTEMTSEIFNKFRGSSRDPQYSMSLLNIARLNQLLSYRDNYLKKKKKTLLS